MTLKPLLQPIDQTSEFAVVSNTVVGASITLTKTGVPIATTRVAELELAWRGQAMEAFEDAPDLEDEDHRLWQADFTGSGKTEVLVYSRKWFNWWLGTFTADKLSWRLIANTKGFGDLLDGHHPIWIGDFAGIGMMQVLFYYNIDQHWWLGTIAGGVLTWELAAKPARFGDGLDGDHPVHIGDFAGLGKDQVLIYLRAKGACCGMSLTSCARNGQSSPPSSTTARPRCCPISISPSNTAANYTAPTHWSGSTRKSNAAPTSSAFSPTRRRLSG
jgi:hypothetical protein